ncbi:outer membrane beta-barrel protein [Thiotrichales bacterium 19S3-7]|nr:outer membrane beta-barrel protein [Thiotrichales bacterium 19S3-7]MCF6800900.1 outer membrane beta-barrel protein [Thiotrichales bacterium 19S3-11]
MKYYKLLMIGFISFSALANSVWAENINDLMNINASNQEKSNLAFNGFYTGLAVNESLINYQYQSTGQNDNLKQNKYGLSLLLGYGHQFKNNLYLGAQGRISYYPNNASDNNILNLSANKWGNFYVGIAPVYSFSLHLLPGYVYHSFLFYGVIGASLTGYNNQFGYHASQWNKNDENGHDSVYLDNQVSALALNLGFGIRYHLMQHVIVGVEYDYAYSSSIAMNRYGPGNANEYIRPEMQSVNLNVDYLF